MVNILGVELTDDQFKTVMVVMAAFAVWYLYMRPAPKDSFVAVPTVPQETLTGTKAAASIAVDGLLPMSLETVTETAPIPFYNQAYGDVWAEIETLYTTDDNQGAVATGSPLPIQTVQQPRIPVFKINIPPIAPPITIPATSLPQGPALTNAMTPSGPNAPQVPPQQEYAYNPQPGVDFPGNDIQCQLYEKVSDTADTCRSFCQSRPDCKGYVDVKPGTSPVVPGGFCCAKNTMTDPLPTPGVDAFHKQMMQPM